MDQTLRTEHDIMRAVGKSPGRCEIIMHLSGPRREFNRRLYNRLYHLLKTGCIDLVDRKDGIYTVRMGPNGWRHYNFLETEAMRKKQRLK